MVCGVCGRRMDAHWVHGRPGYRCRHGRTSAAPRPEHPVRSVYVREDYLLSQLPGVIERAGHDPGDSLSVADYLRALSLEVMCAGGDLRLRSKPPRTSISPEPEFRQLTLPVNLDLRAEDTLAAVAQPQGASPTFSQHPQR